MRVCTYVHTNYDLWFACKIFIMQSRRADSSAREEGEQATGGECECFCSWWLSTGRFIICPLWYSVTIVWYMQALDKAKESSRKERLLCKQREQASLAEQINLDLTYCVRRLLLITWQAHTSDTTAHTITWLSHDMHINTHSIYPLTHDSFSTTPGAVQSR